MRKPVLAEYKVPTLAEPIPHPLPNGYNDLKLMLAYTDDPQKKALLAFQGLCGLRVGEALKVQPVDIDMKNMLLEVHGKGDKIRIVPISPLAWEYIAPAVLMSMAGKRDYVVSCHERSAREYITTCASEVGISSRVSSHDLRATFATETYNLTRDIQLVRKLMGHASVTQTQVYIATKMQALREAVEFYGDDND